MKKNIGVRRVLQVFFFFLIAIIAYNHYLTEEGIGIKWLSNASVHALCPFGGVVSIYQYFVSGTYVKKIHESAFILMWISFILAVGFGPLICGWVCPLGSIQEWISSLGKKILGKRYNNLIPYKYDKIFRFSRYIVLIWVVYMTAMTGKLSFESLDPYSALFHLWSSEIAVGGLIILVITLLTSLIIERPWCKYACPYGALLGISNLFRVFKIRRNERTCIGCNKCNDSCPMNIKVAEGTLVRDHQCISCMKCSSEEVCPIENTVELRMNKGGVDNAY